MCRSRLIHTPCAWYKCRKCNKQLTAAHSSVLDLWQRLIVLYSEKRITRPSDTLPALAGLAQAWSRHVPTAKYLAGLWSTDLCKGLLWRVNKSLVDASSALPSQEYIAPSWSWASTRKPVTWDAIDQQHMVSFVTIHIDSSDCRPAGPDPFGRVEAGWLYTTGRIFQAQVVEELNGGLKLSTGPSQAKVFRLTPDDLEHSRTLVGRDVTCLVYSTNPPLVYSIVILVLAQAPTRYLAPLPPAVRKHSHIFQRLGVMTSDVDGWDYIAHSKELTFYLV